MGNSILAQVVLSRRAEETGRVSWKRNIVEDGVGRKFMRCDLYICTVINSHNKDVKSTTKSRINMNKQVLIRLLAFQSGKKTSFQVAKQVARHT